MAANIITQFVLKQLGKKSLRKTGIATLNKASDPIVQSNVRNIKIQLKNLGINPEDLTSTDDVLKALNYHNALMNQHLKQQFKGLGLGKGIKSLEKKKTPVHKTELTDAELEAEYRRLSSLSPEDVKAEMRAQGLTPVEERPFMGFTPKIVPKDKTLLKDSPEAIAKIKAENKAAAERLRKKKLDEEPDDLASGGLARVGMFGGGPAKKVWQEFIEKLFIKASNDIRRGKGKWAGLNQEQWITQHDNLTKMIKKWEWGGKKGLPEGAEKYLGMNNLQITRAIKEAEKKVKHPEGILDISDPEVASDFTRYIKKTDPQGFKELEQKIQLDSFDPKGRKPNASGGIAGELHLDEGGRIGYARGIGPVGPGQPFPTNSRMPQIDPKLRELMEEYKKRKGLAEILGV